MRQFNKCATISLFLPRYAVPSEEEEKVPCVDTTLANKAIQTLRTLAPKALSGDEPFFLALGLHKPHLPWVFPEKFLDWYPLEDIKLPLNQFTPKGG